MTLTGNDIFWEDLGQPRFIIRHPTHLNRKGKPCRCPFGKHQPRYELEHLGKTAAKIDWLRQRPDMQDEASQQMLTELQNHGAPDSLLPWMVKWIKKGEIIYEPGRVLKYVGDSDRQGWLNPFTLGGIVAMMQARKKQRRGINIDQIRPADAVQMWHEWREEEQEKERQSRGEIVHDFGNGYTIRKLQNADEAEMEGEDMGHCVGGYGNGIDDDIYHIYSLRDEKNRPHATIELDSPHDDVYPPAVNQVQGKENRAPRHDYQEMVNEWLDHIGSSPPKQFEDEYELPQARTVDEYMDIHGEDGDRYEYAPDEYHEALDAGYEPDLYTPEPDWDAIVQDLPDLRHWRRTPHDRRQEFFEELVQQPRYNHMNDFNEALGRAPNSANLNETREHWRQFRQPYYSPQTGRLEAPRWDAGQKRYILPAERNQRNLFWTQHPDPYGPGGYQAQPAQEMNWYDIDEDSPLWQHR